MPSDSLTATARGSAASAGPPAAPLRPPHEGRPEPLLRRVLDASVDATVASFALWTVLYWLGLVTQWRLWASGWLWLAATAGLVGWQVVAVVRTPARAEEAKTDGEPAVPVALPRQLLLVLAGTGAAASAVAVAAAVLE